MEKFGTKFTLSYKCLNTSIQEAYRAIRGGLAAIIELPLMQLIVLTNESG